MKLIFEKRDCEQDAFAFDCIKSKSILLTISLLKNELASYAWVEA
jgi:hypothetical protein